LTFVSQHAKNKLEKYVNSIIKISHRAFIPLENFLMGFTPCEKKLRTFKFTPYFFTLLDSWYLTGQAGHF